MKTCINPLRVMNSFFLSYFLKLEPSHPLEREAHPSLVPRPIEGKIEFYNDHCNFRVF